MTMPARNAATTRLTATVECPTQSARLRTQMTSNARPLIPDPRNSARAPARSARSRPEGGSGRSEVAALASIRGLGLRSGAVAACVVVEARVASDRITRP